MKRRRPDSSNVSTLEELSGAEPGLVELMVIAVPEISASSQVAEALRHLVEDARIRILDLVVVNSEVGGAFTVLEFEDVAGLTLLRDVDGEVGGWLSPDDIALVCDALPARSTALLLVVEDLWAVPLAESLRTCGGRIVGGERVPLTHWRPTRERNLGRGRR